MSADILGTSCDQFRSTVQQFFTSTETRRLVMTDSPGRPPRLSHSSWTMNVCWRQALYLRTRLSRRMILPLTLCQPDTWGLYASLASHGLESTKGVNQRSKDVTWTQQQRSESQRYLLSTPSLHQPVTFSDWKMHERAYEQYFLYNFFL